MEPHRFSQKTWKEDIVLVVEGKKFHVNRAILGTASPVFDRMFEADFKEREMTEIPLPDKKYSDVEEFLLCIYPDCLKDVTDTNVDIVLPLCDEYQVDALKKKCEIFLVNTTNFKTSVKSLLERLSAAIQYDLNDLKARCIDVLADGKVSETKEAMEQFGIPAETQNHVLFTTAKKLELKCDDFSDSPVGSSQILYDTDFNGERLLYRSSDMSFLGHIQWPEIRDTFETTIEKNDTLSDEEKP